MRNINAWLILTTALAGAFGSAVAYHCGHEKGFSVGSAEKEDYYHKGRDLGRYEFRVNADQRRLQEYQGFEIYIQQLQGHVSDLQDRVKELEREKERGSDE
jgi:hypothetical protein